MKGFAFSCVACCTADRITCPIDVVKTRLQLSGELGAKKMYGGVFDVLSKYREKGCSGFMERLVACVDTTNDLR